MTETTVTTETISQFREICSDKQIARLMTLNAVGDLAKSSGWGGGKETDSLIALADYVIGEPDELAFTSTDAGITYGLEPASPFATWADSQPFVDLDWDFDKPAETARVTLEPVVVNDLAGFLTLPDTAVLEDEDGDVWSYGEDKETNDYGWSFPGSCANYTAAGIFETMGDEDDVFPMTVLNPEVLDEPVEPPCPLCDIFGVSVCK